MAGTHDRRFQTLAVALAMLGMAFMAFRLFAHTGGELFYTLDDPYIHLALAEGILHGHFGINPGEAASPSSSILYPRLLALTLAAGLGDWGPLVLNVLPMLGAVWILAGLLARLRPTPEPALLVALPVLILAVNGFALPFTGMEHSLHLWASLLIVAGTIRLTETGRAPLWMLLGIVLAPLLRFEGAALALGGLLALLAWRRILPAALTLAVLVAAFAAHMALMKQLGLPPLPSSVMVKSSASAAAVDSGAGSALATFGASFLAAPELSPGLSLMLCLGLITLCLGLPGPDTRARATVAGLALLAGAGHLAAGKYGWFDRYEIYIAGTVLAALLWLAAPLLRQGNRATGFGILLTCLALSGPYFNATLLTPLAARNIQEQQWQMHRFATEFFPHPVAVNDLGWTSYRNDSYVLDLWGLGSEEARRMAATGRTPAKMEEIVARHGVSWAMIYDSWFPGVIPDSWCHIADLHTIHVTASDGTVAFYLTDPAQEQAMRSALAAFGASLLPGTALTVNACTTR